MADSYFAVLDEFSDGGRYRAGPATAGPWDPRWQHGGPPTALAVTTAERALGAATGRADLLALRVAVEFVGPVPVAEIEAQARVLRAARSAALVETALRADGRPCLLARLWFVRTTDTASLASPADPPPPVPDRPGDPLELSFGYGESLDWRFVDGRMGRPGPAAAWVRPRLPLLEGTDAAGLARVALIADSASGISAELDWAAWSFLNVDLDIHLARAFDGEWLLLDATTQLGPHGGALARSTLSDRHGVVGSSLQTLVLAPRTG